MYVLHYNILECVVLHSSTLEFRDFASRLFLNYKILVITRNAYLRQSYYRRFLKIKTNLCIKLFDLFFCYCFLQLALCFNLFLLEFCSRQQAEQLLPLLAQKPNGLTEVKFKFIQIYGPRSILSTSYFYRFSTTLYCYFQKFLQNRPKIITLKLF